MSDYASLLAAQAVEEILEATRQDGGEPFFIIIHRKLQLIRIATLLDAASCITHMPPGSDLSDGANKLMEVASLPMTMLERKQ